MCVFYNYLEWVRMIVHNSHAPVDHSGLFLVNDMQTSSTLQKWPKLFAYVSDDFKQQKKLTTFF